MNAERIAAIVYLSVSVLALGAQSRHLYRMRRAKAGGGLTRTAACRVGCSTAYVVVGVNALVLRWQFGVLTLTVYVATAVTWWINSKLDDRLARPARARKRPRVITITVGRHAAKEDHDASTPPLTR